MTREELLALLSDVWARETSVDEALEALEQVMDLEDDYDEVAARNAFERYGVDPAS